MNINEYQNKVLRTFNQSNEVKENILQCLLGLNGEVGEVTDLFKKHFFQGHHLEPKSLNEEIGDVMWYIANLCNSLELDLSRILENNLSKLKLRYPEGFSEQASKERSDKEPQYMLCAIHNHMYPIGLECGKCTREQSDITEVNIQKEKLKLNSRYGKFGNKEEIKKLSADNNALYDFMYENTDDLYSIYNPSHYSSKEIEPFDYIQANNLNYFEGNVLKYITRHKEKNKFEDIQKAESYIRYISKNYDKLYK